MQLLSNVYAKMELVQRLQIYIVLNIKIYNINGIVKIRIKDIPLAGPHYTSQQSMGMLML